MCTKRGEERVQDNTRKERRGEERVEDNTTKERREYKIIQGRKEGTQVAMKGERSNTNEDEEERREKRIQV